MAVPEIFQDEIDRLCAEHGLPHIPITQNNRLTRAVARTKMTAFRNDALSMDVCKQLQYMDPKAIVETARHEFAHALEWYHHMTAGHGARWKMYARMLGAIPAAASTEQERIEATLRTTN